MHFLKTLKQKLFSLNFFHSKKSLFALSFLVLFSLFFHSHSANAYIGQDTIVFLLQMVLKFVGLLLSIAETLFQWIVNPVSMKNIMDNSVVYETWRTVRDIFNVAFILVLLYSAFVTIYQADSKHNYKNILLNLVIMALLVNFSYPIARFIADASNIVMFGFLNNLGGTSSFMDIIRGSDLKGIVTSKGTDEFYLLSAIIFTFIFAITLLVIAVLLVIRTITITIYIIFSPIAFVGTILPGTKLASAANEWWTDFTKQCFAGPIMIFMIYIASKMMLAVTTAESSISKIAFSQVEGGASGALGTLISKASFFALPIIILWLGIIQAQKSGIAGAGAVVGAGKKYGKWLAGSVPQTLGVTGGLKKAKDYYKKKGAPGFLGKIPGLRGSERTTASEDWIAGFLTKGRPGARKVTQTADAKKVSEAAESKNVKDLDKEGLLKLKEEGNKYEKAAAIQALADIQEAEAGDLKIVRDAFGEESPIYKQLSNKIKSYNPADTFAHLPQEERIKKLTEQINSSGFDSGKLKAGAFGNAEFMELALVNGAISNDDLDKARKKHPVYARNIDRSLTANAIKKRFDFMDLDKKKKDADDKLKIAEASLLTATSANRESLTQARDVIQKEVDDLDTQFKAAKNVHMMHLAQTGTFSASIESNIKAKEKLISSLNKDTAKRMKAATIQANQDLLGENLDSGKIKDILNNLEDKSAKVDLLRYIRDNLKPNTKNAEASQHKLQNDPQTKNV